MATAQARRLTEAHRLAQARLGADTVRQLTAAFPLLDISDLDRTFPAWLRVVAPIVRTQRSKSAALAADYLVTFRTLHLGDAFEPVMAAPLDPKRLATSMLLTGPASIRANLTRKMPLAKALDLAQTRTAGAGMRHALNGGRETILETVKADKRAVGWARVTSGKTCSFCSMLADRGAVYGEASADFEAHDNCSCSAEPAYS